MSVNLPQDAHLRLVLHRFRACSDEHRDRYHEECPACLLIESTDERCADAAHIHDAGGRCLTCELIDTRVAGANDGRLLSMLRRLKG